MNSSDAAPWFSALVNVALASVLAAHFRRRVKNRVATEAKAKAAYSWFCVGVGILAGFAVFPGATAPLTFTLGIYELHAPSRW